jgi:hypothetical protein
MNATPAPATAIVDGPPRTTLLDALRNEVPLTETKTRGNRGECGALTVLVENRRALSGNLRRFLHRNLSGYLVPTIADIPDVIFAGEFQSAAGPLRSKGLGELGGFRRARRRECSLSRHRQTRSALIDQRREAGVPVRTAGSRNHLDCPNFQSQDSH